MALHNGIDTVAFVTGGVWSKTFGNSALKNRCNLFASYGMIDDAANIYMLIANIVEHFKRMRES